MMEIFIYLRPFCDGIWKKMQQVQLERLRSENTPALSPWTNFKLGFS